MKTWLLCILMTLTCGAWAGGHADPLIGMVNVDELEWLSEDDGGAISATAWLGKDLNKAVLEWDAQALGVADEQWQASLYYSRAISPFFDLLVGGYRERNDNVQRDWLALSLQGTAPYFIEVEATLRARGRERAAELTLSRELLITQRLHLEPELELALFNHRHAAWEQGQGLAELSVRLPLKYAFSRELSVYLALLHERKRGATAALARAEGEHQQETQVAVGLSFWT